MKKIFNKMDYDDDEIDCNCGCCRCWRAFCKLINKPKDRKK